MKYSVFATSALLLLSRRNGLFPAANAQANQHSNQHFGGQNIDHNQFHWFTTVRRRENGEFLCSASLVGSRFVLTARHCVENFPGSSIVVEVGYLCSNRTNCLRKHSFVEVTRWYQHEAGGDMALLALDNAVDIDVKPAVPYLGSSVHPKQSLTKNKKGITMEMVGAGRTEAGRGDPVSFFVRKLEVAYLSPEDCRTQVSDASRVTDFVICSIPTNGNPCAGDSGSALVVPGKKRFAGRDIVMAVHNFGPSNCNGAPDQVSGHFRMEDAADLLQEVICEGEYEPEDWCPNASVPSPSPVVMCDVESPEEEKGDDLLQIKALRGTILHILTGHTETISADGLTFNSDGSRLLSSSWDDSNKLWDPVGGGEALATFVDGSSVYSGQFHPHGNYFASASEDNTVKLWETTSADKPIRVFEGHSQRVRAVSWSPCGTKLASASWDNTFKVWNIVTGQLIATLTGHTRDLESVAFHPEGTQLASASDDGMIKLWNATTNSFVFLQTLENHTSWVWSVSYSPDGKLLASGSRDSTAKVWDVKTGELLHDFREHKGGVLAVTWSPDGQLLATASEDKKVRVWDVRNGGPSLLKLGHEGSVKGLDWSPDGTLLASGLRNSGDIIVWRIIREQ